MSTPTPSNEKKYWVALSHAEALTPLYWKQLLSVFPSAEAIWHASQKDLENAGATVALATNLIQIRKTIDPDAIMDRLAKEDITAIVLNDETYPRLLKEITDPPFVLFVQGELTAEEPVGALGVVGTRKMSSYGQTVLPPIIAECARAGLTIVSGLALGIDGLAHATTMDNGGRTIAAIGSGIDRKSLYPWQHRQLADRIVASGGAIVSEYPPGTEPIAYHFPARNRIISGLSLGVLVTEAPKKSGALITAFAAIDQNREVFAIPAPIHHPNAWGPNDLLKRGAIPVTEAQDILHALPILSLVEMPLQEKKDSKKIGTPPSETETIICTLLTQETLHIDDLVRKSNLTPDAIMSTLVLMEMAGKIRNVGGMQYTLS
ncbi:MAG: DNA-processing protein DprA [bacterium]|nr:DNA-processing protein DprA [bacterium]